MATAADVDISGWARQPLTPKLDGNSPTTQKVLARFFGYPYSQISSITINSIVTADTSAEAPMALFASASDVSATGVRTKSGNSINPYQDLEYRWTLTYSDDSPVEDLEGIIDPRDGSSVNPYTDQIGPEFTCVIREPGSYKLKLTARGKSQFTNTLIEQTATKAITVTASTLSKSWHDIVGGNDANDGLDPWGFGLTTASYTHSTRELTQSGAFASYVHDVSVPYTFRDNYIYITLAGVTGLYEIESKVSDDTIVLKTGLGSDQSNVTSSDGAKQNFDNSDAASGVECMVAGTGTYDLSGAITTNGKANPLAVTAYNGTPALTITSAPTWFLDISTNSSGSTPEYVRLSGLNIQGDGATNYCGQTVTSTSDADTSTLIFDKCDCDESGNDNAFAVQVGSSSTKKLHFIVYNSEIDNTYGTTGKTSSRTATYTEIRNGGWQRYFANTLDNDADNSVLDHFMYPNGDCDNIHCAYINFRNGSGNNYCINTNRDTTGTANYACFNNNLLGPNSKFGFDFSNSNNQSDVKMFDNVVVINNKSNTSLGMVFHYAMLDGYIAYNQAYGGGTERALFVDAGGSNYVADNYSSVLHSNQVYGQKLHIDNTGDSVNGNREITDNVTWQIADDFIFEYTSSDIGNREFVVDGNIFYSPNNVAGEPFESNPTNITLSTFNTEVGGTNVSSAPTWTDPSNGDFDGVQLGLQVMV